MKKSPTRFIRRVDNKFTSASLDLNFQNMEVMDSRVTFSRGSNATLFDSSGNLVYAKHNLLRYSEDFADAAWTKTNATVTANTLVAPNGTTTANTVSDNGTTPARVSQSITVSAGITYTASIYLKAGTQNIVFWREDAQDVLGLSVNLSTGTITSGTGTIESVGNGWYHVTFSGAVTGTSFSPEIRLTSAGTVYAWGAQLNATPMEGGVTSSLSTYYPTVASAYYAPRFDHSPTTLQSLGLLIEEQRTNSIRNNTMQGAVAGTPGTLPTNWFASLQTGISANVIGTGTEDGISYVDIQLVGTAGATGNNGVSFESTTGVVAASGQVWSTSTYAKIVGGSLTNVNQLRLSIIERTSVGGFLTDTQTQIVVGVGNLSTQRFETSRTLNNASTARVTSAIFANVTSGNAIDITLRIGLPQLEQGAFATSVIPTTVAAATRNADVATMTGTNFSSWYNATEGSLYCDVATFKSTASGTVFATSANNNTSSNFIVVGRFSGDDITARVDESGSVQTSLTTVGTYVPSQFYKNVLAYKANNFAAVTDGGTVQTDASGVIPTVDRLSIGALFPLGNQLNGHIRRIAYYPVRLSNDQLQALTR